MMDPSTSPNAASIRQFKGRQFSEDIDPSTSNSQSHTRRPEKQTNPYLAASLLVGVILLNAVFVRLLTSSGPTNSQPVKAAPMPHNHEKTARGDCQSQPTTALQPHVNFDYFKGVQNIEFAKTHYENSMKTVPQYEETKAGSSWGKGIVYVTGFAHFNSTLLSLRMLRGFGCHLPVEVWHLSTVYGDLTEPQMEELRHLGAVLRDLSSKSNYKTIQVFDLEGSQFSGKPAAILNSGFAEILFLDSDTLPARDPTYLFSLPQYTSTGAVFWTDAKRTHHNNPIYKVFNIRCYDELELDNGQFLMNKKKLWYALHAALFMTQNYKYFSQMIYTDKDAYRFACKATKTPYHVVRHPAAVVGFTTAAEKTFCGHTYGQKDPDGHIVFLHMWVFKAVEESESDYQWHFVNDDGTTFNGFSPARPWTAIQHPIDPTLETSHVMLGRLPEHPEVPCLQLVMVNARGRKWVSPPEDFKNVGRSVYPVYDKADGPKLAKSW